jgi:transcriptional regulator with XRE-family HTH domain
MQHFNNLSELGREVARMRREKRLTQKQVAAYAGLGQSTLARFETGQVVFLACDLNSRE